MFASTTSDRQPLLSEAHLDTDFFFRVLERQICEWVLIGVWLFFIVIFDGISLLVLVEAEPGNLSNVDFRKRAVIISGIAAAIGLFVDAWCLSVCPFGIQDLEANNHSDQIQPLALSLDGSNYLSSRLPFLAFFISVLAFVAFIASIVWPVSPTTVLLVGLLLGLPLVVYACERIFLGFAWVERTFNGPATATAVQGEKQTAPPTISVQPAAAPNASTRVPAHARRYTV